MFVQYGWDEGTRWAKLASDSPLYSDEHFPLTFFSFVFRPSDDGLKLVVWSTYYEEGGCEEDVPMCDFKGSPNWVFKNVEKWPLEKLHPE